MARLNRTYLTTREKGTTPAAETTWTTADETHLLEQDIDIRVIQTLLGHTKLDTTALLDLSRRESRDRRDDEPLRPLEETLMPICCAGS